MSEQTIPYRQAKSGIAIPQARTALPFPVPRAFGTITYRCHTCGELIVKPWEVFFADQTPGREWASTIVPGKVTKGTTTHHDWHLASQQRED